MSDDKRYFEYKHCLSLPSDIPKKNKLWPKNRPTTPVDLSIDQCDLEDFNIILLDEMHKWTGFNHLNALEREILWLMELSLVIVPKDATTTTITTNTNTNTNTNPHNHHHHAINRRRRFEYIQANMTQDLAAFVQHENIQSASQLLKVYLRTIPAENKVEFIGKRRSAKRAIDDILLKLKALRYPKMEFIPRTSNRWLRFRYQHSDQTTPPPLHNTEIQQGDHVYIMDYSRHWGGDKESTIRCYKGEVLGKRMRGNQVAYYSLMLENHVVEHVHEDSIMTKAQLEEFTKDQVSKAAKDGKVVEGKDKDKDQAEIASDPNGKDKAMQVETQLGVDKTAPAPAPAEQIGIVEVIKQNGLVP